MTIKEKHKWLLDNYKELNNKFQVDLFIAEMGSKYEQLYNRTYFLFNEMNLPSVYIQNEMILLINLLYHKLKK